MNYEEGKDFIKEKQRGVILNEYTLTDMLWFMENYHKSKVKSLNLHAVSIAERKLNAMIEVVDFFGDTANTTTRATMCDIINRI